MPRTIPATPPEYDSTRVIERPDGFFWLERETGLEYGPFDTLQQALDDMTYDADSCESGDSVVDAEQELGLADWVDKDTGELAEETLTRLEDH